MNLPTKQADGSGRFYEYVIDNIRQMIADGELQAGQKLPSERELAEKFNVSRVPIRERSRSWSIWGCWTAARRRHLCEEHLRAEPGQQDEFLLRRHGGHHPDLLELRIVLETFAAYHAAQRRTDEDIASIQKLLRDMREAKKVNDGTEESVQNLRKLSHGFHQALVRAAHNAVLSSVYEYLYELLDISRQFTINNSGISYSSIVAHEALFSKVIEGDAEGARQCMEEHMEDVRYNLRSTMGTDHPGQKAAFG